jgi:hypothetical protein
VTLHLWYGFSKAGKFGRGFDLGFMLRPFINTVQDACKLSGQCNVNLLDSSMFGLSRNAQSAEDMP